MNRRRGLLIALGASALVAPAAVRAQYPGRVHRIGYLGITPRPPDDDFRAGLRDLGYVEGRNLIIEYRWGESGTEAVFAGLARELIASKVDLIVSVGSPATLAAKQATNDIPIVLVDVADPVAAGFVPALQRPGGNVTGVSAAARELGAKALQLLKEINPRLTRVAMFVNVTNPLSVSGNSFLESAGRTLKLQLDFYPFRTPDEFQAQLAALSRKRPEAIFVRPDHLIFTQREKIIAFVTEQRIPAVYGLREYALAGGLLVIAPDRKEIFRRAAVQVDKVLKGAKPGDLSIEQPTKFELIVNLKTAKALEIKIPQSVLVQATNVIE